MQRIVLEQTRIHPVAREKLAQSHRDIVEECEAAVKKHDVVVIGMKQNPHPKRAKKLLEAQKIAFEYLEYGSYFGPWRRRNALKMWTGWPTFPMIFVKGTFIGGAAELEKLIETGELAALLGPQA